MLETCKILCQCNTIFFFFFKAWNYFFLKKPKKIPKIKLNNLICFIMLL